VRTTTSYAARHAPPHHHDGHATVVVDEPTDIGNDPDGTAALLRLLRECDADGVRVVWTARRACGFDTSALHHLPPPYRPFETRSGTPAAEPPDPALLAWRAAYRRGNCHFRHGPGFVLVKDARDPANVARFTLDHPDLVAAFTHCLEPTRRADLDARAREAMDLLIGERLAIDLDGVVLTLPVRMRRWPIPYNSV